MNTTLYRNKVIYVLIGVMICVMTACQREPPEQRLRQTITDMQAAIENGMPREFMAHVTADFIGNDALDYTGLNNLLRGQVLLNARIGIQTGPLNIEMQSDTATVRFTVLLTGSGGGLLPERGQMQQVVSGWREIEGQWQLYSAQWHPIGS